jgi:hypothetical protein
MTSYILKDIKLYDPRYCEDCPLTEYSEPDTCCKITGTRLEEEKVYSKVNHRDFWFCIRPPDCPLIEEE